MSSFETPDEVISINPLDLMDDKDQQVLQRLYLYGMLGAKTLSLTVEVFLRRRFGERYMGALSFFGSFLSMFSLVLSSLALGSITESGVSILMLLHAIAFLIVCSMHQMAILGRIRINDRWHSRYSGIPLEFWQKLSWPKNAGEHAIKRFLEPGCLVIISIILWPIDGVYSLYLMLASGAMFIRANLEHLIQYGRMLDALDSQINAEEMNKAVEDGRQPADCNGVSIAGIVRAGRVRLVATETPSTGREHLDPRLQSMMKPKDQDGENKQEAEDGQ